MLESINTLIGIAFRGIVSASGITSILFLLTFLTLKIFKVRQPAFVYNTYLALFGSFLLIPLVAVIFITSPIYKPHIKLTPALFIKEDIRDFGVDLELSFPALAEKAAGNIKLSTHEEIDTPVVKRFLFSGILPAAKKYLPLIWFTGFLVSLGFFLLNLIKLIRLKTKATFLKEIDPAEYGFFITRYTDQKNEI